MLDDLVLDVGSYAKYHPGGAFLIEWHVGKDVSKYFYGSTPFQEGLKGYSHSNVAI